MTSYGSDLTTLTKPTFRKTNEWLSQSSIFFPSPGCSTICRNSTVFPPRGLHASFLFLWHTYPIFIIGFTDLLRGLLIRCKVGISQGKAGSMACALSGTNRACRSRETGEDLQAFVVFQRGVGSSLIVSVSLYLRTGIVLWKDCIFHG